MFTYIAYQRIEAEDTTLEFRGGDELVQVNYFDGGIVSISAESQESIDALIAQQPAEINCTVITLEEFKTAVSESRQINNIRRQTKDRIATRYSAADEIGMLKKPTDDPKKAEYEAYVTECIDWGDGEKAMVGY